jgi:hypothetical protein
MLLYHGTSLSRLNGILHTGIQPRRNGECGNWQDFPSKEGFVYLTDAYAGYFAAHATDKTDPADMPVILEVSVATKDLYPDEDPLAQEWARKLTRPLRDVHDSIDILDYKHLWKDSLDFIGNVAHFGSIAAAKIKRVALIADEGYWSVAQLPEIGIEHYRSKGGWYRDLIRLGFGDVESVCSPALMLCPDGMAELVKKQFPDNPQVADVKVRDDDRFLAYRPVWDIAGFCDALNSWRSAHSIVNPVMHKKAARKRKRSIA